MNSVTVFYIVARGALTPPKPCVRRKQRPSPLWSGPPSDSTREKPQLRISNSMMATPLSSPKVWKSFRRPPPSSSPHSKPTPQNPPQKRKPRQKTFCKRQPNPDSIEGLLARGRLLFSATQPSLYKIPCTSLLVCVRILALDDAMVSP